ncbi:MAG: DUF547 domain-containing protein [Gemmatimonadota bacterium]
MSVRSLSGLARSHRIAAMLLTAWSLTATVQAEAQSFDHSAFDRLLGEHVDPQGFVDYDAFVDSPDLEAYLDALARVDMSLLPATERLALWINAYNAYTIALINKHEERRSIRNINRTLGFLAGKGPWTERIARVGGATYTLDEIEHAIIRPRFLEPRIHFALVCAAAGCPPLRQEAYTGAELEAQLDDQAEAFLLESPARNRVDVATGAVHLSPIFDWYGEDFGRDDRELLRYVARFFPDGPERDLLLKTDTPIRFTDYDWSLNIQPR